MTEIDDYAPALLKAKDAIKKADIAFPMRNRGEAMVQALRLQHAADALMASAEAMDQQAA